MVSVQKLNCSWSLVATIVSIVALVSVVQLFLFPSGPSFNYFGYNQVKDSCVLINGTNSGEIKGKNDNLQKKWQPLNARFPADLHKAVVYRGAPWKAEIGQWLSGCSSVASPMKVNEQISGKKCEDDCSGQGVCNHEFGQCRCFHGFNGDGCSERQELSCNYPATEELPYGRWVVSICSASCDTTRAMCFCGEGTKYPNRPVAESCGFQVIPPTEPGAPKGVDWSKSDHENIFTTNASLPGWCNVDPVEAYALKVKFKEECDCKYDGLFGRFCETIVSSTCINQCSGQGHCRGGFCQCDNGWYGVDCSIPSVHSAIDDWPQWLRPSQVSIPDNGSVGGNIVGLKAVVEKKRPLIYVYDLPPEFNSILLEGRHFKFECINRIYDQDNATVWTDQLYGSQIAMYESMLASPHRTLNGEEADYYFVPALDSCIITRADDSPHLSMEEHRGLRSSFTLEFYRKAHDHIIQHYPYWNRSSGKDHIWSFSWDEGACYAPKEIWNSMMLVHWGNTNSKHNHSTTAYWGDNWDEVSPDRRGNHTCFDPDKDLVIPAWKRPDGTALSLKLWARPRKERKTLFYFNGNLGPAYEHGRPEATYSMGIRQKLAEEFGSSPNKKGELGKQHAEDVIVMAQRSDTYYEDLASSVFCGVMPGDGWSGRMEDSILQGCIPVVIQDGIFLPWENVLNYESFAVRLGEGEIPNLINILRGFNETEVEFMLTSVKNIWQRYFYRDAIMLEAERQKSAYGYIKDWAETLSELSDDDVFTTFIQILHYKLYNDPWRRQQTGLKKETGIPQECLFKV
ncbi:exostosin family protein [Tanacetum coccineum]|uniref:Exostosin family protein n=1 Tax=Tanacetum coccineum TaxID=301880 RepID=A0ABQ5GEX8_9ASTR